VLTVVERGILGEKLLSIGGNEWKSWLFEPYWIFFNSNAYYDFIQTYFDTELNISRFHVFLPDCTHASYWIPYHWAVWISFLFEYCA